MLRSIMIAATALAFATGASAAPCKDPKTGRFAKCPPPAGTSAGARCKDAKGRFAKCGTPGATPVASAKK